MCIKSSICVPSLCFASKKRFSPVNRFSKFLAIADLGKLQPGYSTSTGLSGYSASWSGLLDSGCRRKRKAAVLFWLKVQLATLSLVSFHLEFCLRVSRGLHLPFCESSGYLVSSD